MLIEVIGMPWGSMPCGGFQEAKNRPCLGYQPETEGAKPRTPLFKISNNLLILGEELSEVREIEKPGNLGQTGFPRVLVFSMEDSICLKKRAHFPPERAMMSIRCHSIPAPLVHVSGLLKECIVT